VGSAEAGPASDLTYLADTDMETDETINPATARRYSNVLYTLTISSCRLVFMKELTSTNAFPYI
jgi:hypothetical protein